MQAGIGPSVFEWAFKPTKSLPIAGAFCWRTPPKTDVYIPGYMLERMTKVTSGVGQRCALAEQLMC